jgi:hypothetical protein
VGTARAECCSSLRSPLRATVRIARSPWPDVEASRLHGSNARLDGAVVADLSAQEGL